MKPGILQNILSLFDENATRVIAGRLAERHANVVGAVERIIPTILYGFASKSKEGPETANHLMQLAIEASDSNWWQKVLSYMGDNDKAQKGHEILQQMFGTGNIDRLGNAIAQKTMVRTSSAVRLMQWAATLCMAMLGKEASEKNYDAPALAAVLAKEPVDIDEEGIAGNICVARPDIDYKYANSPLHTTPANRMVVILPLLILFTLLAIVLWLMRYHLLIFLVDK